MRLALLGSALGPELVTHGHWLIASGPSGTGKTHLVVALAYRAIQNGFDARFPTATALIDALSVATRKGKLGHALPAYTHPHVLVIDEVSTRHIKLDLIHEPKPSSAAPARISGDDRPSSPEPTRVSPSRCPVCQRPLWSLEKGMLAVGWWPSEGGTRDVGWRRSSFGAAGSSLVAALTLLDASSPGRFEKARRR